ncbi:hypothetical protein STEG23_020677 [Scotinomys teguina]
MVGAKSLCELPKIIWLEDDWDHKISEHEFPEGKAAVERKESVELDVLSTVFVHSNPAVVHILEMWKEKLDQHQQQMSFLYVLLSTYYVTVC